MGCLNLYIYGDIAVVCCTVFVNAEESGLHGDNLLLEIAGDVVDGGASDDVITFLRSQQFPSLSCGPERNNNPP